MWVLAWWVANSAEQESCEVGWVAGTRGRNASRRLGGDGPRRRRSGLQATRGPRQRRVCSRGLGLRAIRRRRRHLGGDGRTSQWKVSNKRETDQRVPAISQCLCATFIGCCSALRGCKYEGVSGSRGSRPSAVTAAMKRCCAWSAQLMAGRHTTRASHHTKAHPTAHLRWSSLRT